MRLSKREINALTRCIQPWLNHEPTELRLYGSRTDLQKKGGDIDLLLIVSSDTCKRQVIEHMPQFFAELFQLIPEQKIDLIVITKTELAQHRDPFIEVVYPTSVLIHQF